MKETRPRSPVAEPPRAPYISAATSPSDPRYMMPNTTTWCSWDSRNTIIIDARTRDGADFYRDVDEKNKQNRSY